MRSFRTEGIIIKRRNYGEADRMLTVFTKRHGKIQVVAKGVRRITSRRASHIELLNHSLLFVYKGKGLPVLTEVQAFSDYSEIKEDLTKVGFAYHICELIDGLCPDHQENRSVFHLLLLTLERLSKLSCHSERSEESRSFGFQPQDEIRRNDSIVSIIHEFEIELLSTLGFFPRYKPSYNFNTVSFIENILERRLKSRQILRKLT